MINSYVVTYTINSYVAICVINSYVVIREGSIAMSSRLLRREANTRKLIHSGCSWCRYGKDPVSLQEYRNWWENEQTGRLPSICEQCHISFKRLLCSADWKKERLNHLVTFPHCANCLHAQLYTPATDVDHIIEWRHLPSLFWYTSIWQSLCHSCHSLKTGGILLPCNSQFWETVKIE